MANMQCLTCVRIPVVLVIASAILLITVDADSFLKANLSSHQELISKDDVQKRFLEAEGGFRIGTGSKLKELEALLAPMFVALPKNAHGRLGPSTVRYALHRLFVQRHGWFIKGLQDAGGHRNSSGTVALFKEQVPAYVQNMFERRLNFRGFSLRELGVFAATMEHLVHNEAVNLLGKAYQVQGLLPSTLLNESAADDVLDTYMTSFILGEDLSNMTTEEALATKADMPEVCVAWNATQKFVRGVRQQITRTEQPTSGALEFSVVAHIAEQIGERFGSFQDHECQQIKAALVAKEEGNTGRVRLSDFWRPAVDAPESDGAWQSTESFEYLRQLGVLDESDVQIPRVMIANYIASASNCIASSSYYSVCCINECDNLLSNLEKQIAAPEASPKRIAALVASMSSSSVVAPRVLPKSLLRRLEEVASGDGGFVQVYGRLFAQWMHHAFPRECPFPHVSGTTTPLTPDEWERTGKDSIATDEEMRAFIKQAPNKTEQLGDDDLPWLSEEELLVVRSSWEAQRVGETSDPSCIPNVIAVAAIVFAIYRLLRTTSVTKRVISEKLVV